MIAEASAPSKGKVTIARKCGERLGLKPGDKIAFAVPIDGTPDRVRAKTLRFIDQVGLLRRPDQPLIHIKAMKR